MVHREGYGRAKVVLSGPPAFAVFRSEKQLSRSHGLESSMVVPSGLCIDRQTRDRAAAGRQPGKRWQRIRDGGGIYAVRKGSLGGPKFQHARACTSPQHTPRTQILGANRRSSLGPPRSPRDTRSLASGYAGDSATPLAWPRERLPHGLRCPTLRVSSLQHLPTARPINGIPVEIASRSPIRALHAEVHRVSDSRSPSTRLGARIEPPSSVVFESGPLAPDSAPLSSASQSTVRLPWAPPRTQVKESPANTVRAALPDREVASLTEESPRNAGRHPP